MEYIECVLTIRNKPYSARLEIDCNEPEKAIDYIEEFCQTIKRTYTKELGLIDQDTGEIIYGQKDNYTKS
jgi:hypothetical protein